MILVTGASGALGGLVLDRLTAAAAEPGPRVAGGTRAPAPGSGLRRVDFDDPATLRDGFAGVDVLLLVSAGYAEDDVVMARHGAVAEVAAAAGVRHVIYTSLAGSGERLTFALPHRWTERRLAAGPFATTVLRNGLYPQVPVGLALAAGAAAAGADVFSAPFGDGGLPVVCREDLADAAARVAREADADLAAGDRPGRHAGRTYELEGVERLDGEGVAALLTGESGRTVRYRTASLGAAREALAANGLPPYQIGHTLSTFANIQAGWLTAGPSDLPALLDAPPRPVRDPVLETLRSGGYSPQPPEAAAALSTG
ncbi:MAG: NAD(P)H-binding protein [Streptomyces sp.]|nr:NAD(P)H-binding protein [Streptomyces sp.]